MSKKAEREAERAEALEELRKLVKPGARVYCILRNVSRSGMQRKISPYVKTDDGMQWLDGYACRAMGWRRDCGFKDSIVVNGCGMDMGFALVYELSAALFRDGFDCIGEGCPANDHSNGDRNYEPHRHSDPGYALRHEWL